MAVIPMYTTESRFGDMLFKLQCICPCVFNLLLHEYLIRYYTVHQILEILRLSFLYIVPPSVSIPGILRLCASHLSFQVSLFLWYLSWTTYILSIVPWSWGSLRIQAEPLHLQFLIYFLCALNSLAHLLFIFQFLILSSVVSNSQAWILPSDPSGGVKLQSYSLLAFE